MPPRLIERERPLTDDVAVTDVAVAEDDVAVAEDVAVVQLPVVERPAAFGSVPEVNAAVVALLERSREGLRTAGSDLDARTRWAGAHLAALRAATAVLAVRGKPGPARSRPRSVWQVLPRLAPELAEWAVFLGSLQRLPERSVERRDARAADDLLRDAEQFLCAVTRVLSLPWRPVLPDVVPASR